MLPPVCFLFGVLFGPEGTDPEVNKVGDTAACVLITAAYSRKVLKSFFIAISCLAIEDVTISVAFAAAICSSDKTENFSTGKPTIFLPRFTNPIEPLTMYPRKLARTPVIIIRGPATAVITVANFTKFLIGSGSLLPNSIICEIRLESFSSGGISIFVIDSPTGSKAALIDSIARWNLIEEDSVRVLISPSAIFARSSEEALISFRTSTVWDPEAFKLSKSAEILANWYLPKSCSIICALPNSSRV